MSNNPNVVLFAGTSHRLGTAVDDLVALLEKEAGDFKKGVSYLHTQLEKEASDSPEECFVSEAPEKFETPYEMCGICTFEWPDTQTECGCGFTILNSQCEITISVSDEPRKGVVGLGR